MQRLSILVVALAAACTTSAANAGTVHARFTGLVESQVDGGDAIGSPISGSFVYDTDSASFLSYSIGGFSAAPGSGSSAAFSADQYSALYRSQLSPVEQGGTLNSTLTLDLEAADDPWAASNAIALLSDSRQLASDLDLTGSFFGVYRGNADGTGVHSLTARLTGLTVTAAVPEPSTFALLALGLGAWALGRARHR